MKLSIMCPNLKYKIAPLTFMHFSPSKTLYFEKKSIQLDEQMNDNWKN